MKYYIQDRQARKRKDHPAGDPPEKFGVSEKMNVAEQLVTAVTKPEKLPGLARLAKKKTVRYVLFLICLVSFMITVMPSVATVAGFGGFRKLFLETMPKFTVEKGELSAEDHFSLLIRNVTLLIDTDTDAVTQDDLDRSGVYLAFGRKTVSFLIYQKALGSEEDVFQEVSAWPVSSLFPDGTTNQNLYRHAWLYIPVILGIFLWEVIALTIRYWFLACLYALCMRSKFQRTMLDFTSGDFIRMCFYAQTIGILAVNINQALSGILPSTLVSLAGIIITFLWLNKAVKSHLRNSSLTDSTPAA